MEDMLAVEMMRPQIWHWVLYTQEDPSEVSYDAKMHGFIRSMFWLMDNDGSLGELSSSVLIKTVRDKLLEFYLCQLPALFLQRHKFLQLVLNTFDKITRCLVEEKDARGICLLTKF
jgi:hypothetical protein